MIALCSRKTITPQSFKYILWYQIIASFNISLEGTSYFVLLDDGRELIQDQLKLKMKFNWMIVQWIVPNHNLLET